jgi:hypothetical protein
LLQKDLQKLWHNQVSADLPNTFFVVEFSMADEVWDEAKLLGKGIDGGGAEAAKANPLLWGVPGYLTQDECDVYVSKKSFPAD